MRRRFGWVALVVALALGSANCAVVNKLKARDQMNKGASAYKEKRWSQAVEHFQKAMELDPGLTNAQVYLATTYRTQYIPGATSKENKNLGTQAMDTFKAILARDANNLNAIANVAGLYNDMEEYDEARKWRLKQLELQPNNPEPLYANAVIDWQQVYAKTGPNAELVKDMAADEKAALVKQTDSGIDSLKRALQINPEYENAFQYYNLLLREKAKLTSSDDEKKQYLKEADRLALKYIEITKKKKAEEEEARKRLGGAAK
ncbi:MAG: tetratricopeptide repeat protein [Acidobacteriota bacterium]